MQVFIGFNNEGDYRETEPVDFVVGTDFNAVKSIRESVAVAEIDLPDFLGNFHLMFNNPKMIDGVISELQKKDDENRRIQDEATLAKKISSNNRQEADYYREAYNRALDEITRLNSSITHLRSQIKVQKKQEKIIRNGREFVGMMDYTGTLWYKTKNKHVFESSTTGETLSYNQMVASNLAPGAHYRTIES